MARQVQKGKWDSGVGKRGFFGGKAVRYQLSRLHHSANLITTTCGLLLLLKTKSIAIKQSKIAQLQVRNHQQSHER